MKKLGLLCTLVAVLLFITGCGNKDKVVCTQGVSGVKVDMIMTFKEEILDTMGLQYTVDLTNYSDEQVKQIESQNLCSTVKTAMGTYGNAFENCKQKTSNRQLIVTADFDIEKLPGFSDSRKDTKKEAIEQLEEQGYKCGN